MANKTRRRKTCRKKCYSRNGTKRTYKNRKHRGG